MLQKQKKCGEKNMKEKIGNFVGIMKIAESGRKIVLPKDERKNVKI